jgi:hypothetical protein
MAHLQDAKDAGQVDERLYRLVIQAASRDWCARQEALGEAWELAANTDRRDVRAIARIIARALVTDAVDVVRSDALEALGEIGGPSDHRAVIQAMGDECVVVRSSAVASSGDLIGARAVPRIKAMLDDRHPVVRKYAALALYDTLGCTVTPELRRRLEAEKSQIARVGILFALAICGDLSARIELENLARHPDAKARASARELLAEIDEAHEPKETGAG